MKRHLLSFALIGIALTNYGCGANGSSTTETSSSSSTTTNTVMSGVTLINSKQGISGGFVDVDGDTYEDKVVGAPYATKSSTTGAVLVYKGDGTGKFSSTPTSLITGDDNMGYSFVKLPKGSNDSVAQFAVSSISGSRDNDGDASLTGTVSIYKGGTSGPVLVAKLAGESAMDKFGVSTAAGDFNSDGYTDIAVGAPFHTPDATLYQQGAVYVYFGPDFTDAGRVAMRASSTYKGLGWQVATGDVNNDTYTDLLVSTSGKVLVYKGVASGSAFAPVTGTPTVIGTPNITITNAATGFGKQIAVLSDLDGDGYKEIAIGAPNATVNGYRDTGSVYIVKGTNAATTTTLAQMDGTSLFDRFGSSLAAVADMDGDSKLELVVGATMVNVDPYYLSGKIYLFKSASRSGSSWSPASGFKGTLKDQSYGTFLQYAGDNRILIGAPTSNMNTGGVSMVDLNTGSVVAEGSSGGGGGDTGDCH